MASTKPVHQVRNDKVRHDAITDLSELRGFNSVSDYLNHLIDEDAVRIGFELPPHTDYRGEHWKEKKRKS